MGDLVLISGRPGRGKSALAFAWAANLTLGRKPADPVLISDRHIDHSGNAQSTTEVSIILAKNRYGSGERRLCLVEET